MTRTRDPSYCAAIVWAPATMISYQCTRAPKDGSKWCWQHHPDAKKRRDEEAAQASRAEWDAKVRARIETGLRDATIEQLRAEIARRES